MVEAQHQHNAHQHHAQKARRIRPLHIVAPIAVIAIIAVIYVATNISNAATVAVGDTIGVYYTGTLTNGTVFDSNVGKSPLTFTVGSGQLIQGFDKGVVGMKLNETKTITIPSNEAYGAVQPSLVITVPRSQFGNLTPVNGMVVSSGNGQHGTVKSFNASNVVVDFNPPLAGKTLIFKITIASIKK